MNCRLSLTVYSIHDKRFFGVVPHHIDQTLMTLHLTVAHGSKSLYKKYNLDKRLSKKNVNLNRVESLQFNEVKVIKINLYL